MINGKVVEQDIVRIGRSTNREIQSHTRGGSPHLYRSCAGDTLSDHLSIEGQIRKSCRMIPNHHDMVEGPITQDTVGGKINLTAIVIGIDRRWGEVPKICDQCSIHV